MYSVDSTQLYKYINDIFHRKVNNYKTYMVPLRSISSNTLKKAKQYGSIMF